MKEKRFTPNVSGAKKLQPQVGLQRYTGAPVNRDIFCHDTNIDI